MDYISDLLDLTGMPDPTNPQIQTVTYVNNPTSISDGYKQISQEVFAPSQQNNKMQKYKCIMNKISLKMCFF